MHYKTVFSMAVTLILTLSCKGPSKELPAPAESAQKGENKPLDPATGEDNAERPGQQENSVSSYAEAALSIGYLLSADTISWTDIESKYKMIQSHVEAVDNESKTSYGKEIPQALAEIKGGKSIEVNRHIVTKGLQHVTVLAIEQMLDQLISSELEATIKISENIKAAFSAIEPTFKRRDDTVYSGKPTLVPAAEAALGRLMAAESKPAIANAAMELSNLLSKTYVLSVLFEMKGVEEFCGAKATDTNQCAIKRVEAGIYYRIIKKAVASRDAAADAEIEKMINSEHGVPSYAATRDLLAKILPFNKEDLTF